MSIEKNGHVERNQEPIIAEELQNKIDGLKDNEKIRVVIKMAKSAEIHTQTRSTVQSLQETAKLTQKPVLDYLRKGFRGKGLHVCKSFWITNLICAEVNKSQITDLAKFPGIKRIYEDCVIKALPTNHMSTDVGVWDSVGFIKAPEAWAQGYRGQQVKVAVMDTGVDISHPELVGAMGGEPPYYNGYWVEFDEDGNPVRGSVPHDTDEHGTHVSGTVLGRNVNLRIGVAPEAVLGHALILPNGSGTLAQVLAGMEWAIENDFQVLNGSLGIDGVIEDLAEAVHNLVLAGVFPAFAIGNSGMDISGAPGNSPQAEAVGAIDSDGEVAEFSGGGIVAYPDYIYINELQMVKPDIVAPGVAITSAVPGGDYEAFNGTSMATPHLAGAVAILLSKNPELTVDQIKEILHTSVGGFIGLSDDPGLIGKDTRYGWGRLNVLQAIAQVPEGRPRGLVEGYVQGFSEFIPGAELTFRGPETKSFLSGHHGFYLGSLMAGIYEVTIRAQAYQTLVRMLSIIENDTLIANFTLEAAPPGWVVGEVVDADTGAGLEGVEVEAIGTSQKSYTGPEGIYKLTLKEGKYELNFKKDGYFSSLTENVQVRQDGIVESNTSLRFGSKTFKGQIVDELTEESLPSVFIEVEETGESIATDEDGRFVLDLAAGKFTVRIDQIGYRKLAESVEVSHGLITGDTYNLPPVQVERLFDCNFEENTDLAKWKLEGGWHLTKRRSFSNGQSLWNGDEKSGKYPNNQKAYLLTQKGILIPDTGKTLLNFRILAQTEPEYDIIYLIIGDGEEFVEVYQHSGSMDYWKNIYFDLTEYAGKEILLGFGFDSDYSVTYEGVFIDDVVVYQPSEE